MIEVNAIIVLGFITYLVAELLKGFKVNSAMVPFVNLSVGIIATVVVLLFKVESWNVLEATIFCVGGAMGAGGLYDFKEAVKNWYGGSTHGKK